MNIEKGSKYIQKLKHYYRQIKRKFFQKKEIEVFNNDVHSINKIFVINLDRQKNRWLKLKKEAHSQKLLNGVSLKKFIERIPAVDGKQVDADKFSSTELIKLYDLKEHFFIDPDPRLSHLVQNKEIKICMTAPEIAVALSHIKVWKTIVSRKIPFSLILEDDVYFELDFGEIANSSWSELPNNNNQKEFDLLYFSYREVDNGSEKIDFSKNLFKPIRGYWWLSGYVLSLSGAQKLLSSLPVYGPVDMWMNLQFQNLDVFFTQKSIISQRRDWESGNSYSIMPILSRVGIHLNQENKKIKKSITQKPLFAIGLNKTGTTSLHFALTLLGYKCCHWISDTFSDDTANLIDNNLPLPFDAYTDVESVITRFKQLDLQYPNAAFILTTRNLADWISSRSRHVIRNRTENAKGANHKWTTIDVDLWKREREEHHKEVLQYFKTRPNKLLIIDICKGDGWKPLCKFLNLPIPNTEFPNVDPLIKLKTLSRSLMNRIPISSRDSTALEHDSHPWIKRPETIDHYFGKAKDLQGFGIRTGSFIPQITDNFRFINSVHWELLDNTFPYNLVKFNPNNVSKNKDNGISISLKKEKSKDRDYSSASLKSKEQFQFGRFEIELKPVKKNGVITAFFLYRIDPWQEIDIEFLGNDTSKMLTNVYFNPGNDGTMQNFGTSGTPVLINLGFDASNNFHHYAIEWDPNEIRWFVDDDLVHVRKTGYPTPIPNLPMNVHINLWATRNAKLAGKFDFSLEPQTCCIKSVLVSKWQKPKVLDTNIK